MIDPSHATVSVAEGCLRTVAISAHLSSAMLWLESVDFSLHFRLGSSRDRVNSSRRSGCQKRIPELAAPGTGRLARGLDRNRDGVSQYSQTARIPFRFRKELGQFYRPRR